MRLCSISGVHVINRSFLDRGDCGDFHDVEVVHAMLHAGNQIRSDAGRFVRVYVDMAESDVLPNSLLR
jgi:hypothetical protein